MNIEKLIEDHLHIPEIYAKKYSKVASRFTIGEDDLIGLGNLGLVKAANRYTELENATFQTFANRYVEGTIRNGIRDWGASPYCKRVVKELTLKIKKIEGWEKLDTAQLVELTGADKRDVVDAVNLLSGEMVSIDASEEDEDGLHSFFGRMGDYSIVIVNEFMESLSDKELEALKLSGEGYGQKEIGNFLGVTQMTASRLLRQYIGSKWKQYSREDQHVSSGER